MPPRPRSAPVKKPAAPKPSVVEQLADDAAAVQMPTEYPPGTPEFLVLLAVRPRGRRAEFKRLLAEISEKSNAAREEQVAMQGVTDDRKREQAMFRLSAALDDTLEVIEKALRLVAVDPEKFDDWVVSISDEDLQVVWAVYQQRTQPGEA